MRQQMGAQRGPGQRDPMDPFGRALSDDEGPGGDAFAREGSDVLPMGADIDRSRQIFEELRTRRNEPQRPKIERDYLDRLLQAVLSLTTLRFPSSPAVALDRSSPQCSGRAARPSTDLTQFRTYPNRRAEYRKGVAFDVTVRCSGARQTAVIFQRHFRSIERALWVIAVDEDVHLT